MSVKLVCTGWYSADKADWKTYGDAIIRSKRFRKLWWASINKFVKPEKIFMVDSNSPLKPNDHEFSDTSIELINLMSNPGHSSNTKYHYSGWMASVILGLEYVLVNDLDFFLYIEQDVLIYGDEFIQEIEKSLLSNKYVFGSGEGTPQPLQQSVFAIRKDGIRDFLSKLHRIDRSDRIISPEIKFDLATQPRMLFLFFKFLCENNQIKLYQRLRKLFSKKYTHLPFGYGRQRPIDFQEKLFYFQHGSNDELEEYKQLIKFHNIL